MIWKNKIGLIFLSVGLVLAATVPSFAGKYAIVNGTIITVAGDTITNGTLLIEGQTIAKIGKNLPVPADYEKIDATELFVYPGMIDAASSLGLSEVGSVAATQDAFEMGTYNAHIKTSVAVNPHSVHIPITRVNGITSAMVMPSGGVISGQCSLINLNGWTIDEMLVQEPVGILINFPRAPSAESRQRRRGAQPASAERTQKQIEELKNVFEKARRYRDVWAEYERNRKPPVPEKDLMLEALVPVLDKKVPAIIAVRAEKDIQNAVRFVKEVNIRAVFLGADDGWKTADLLSRNQIPVIVGPVLRTPGSKDPYDARYANAAILHKAGVKVAFFTGSASDARNLPYQAGTAAAFGLPREEALKAVTLNAAEILGVGDRLGSLEPGKMANIIVTTGDPLEMLTQVRHLFIAGEKVSLETKHTKLYEKFMQRPKAK